MRFERTVDRTGCVAAVDRAAALMAEIGGGRSRRASSTPTRPATPTDAHPCASRACTRYLASRSRRRRPRTFLRGWAVESNSSRIVSRSRAELPPRPRARDRPGRGGPADLGHGAGRGHAASGAGGSAGSREQRLRDRIGATLRAAGLNETMTYAFADPTDLDRCGMSLADDELPVELLNPMSGEQAVLRRSLLPGLVRSVSFNQRRGVHDIHLYEMGSTFVTSEGRKQPKQRDGGRCACGFVAADHVERPSGDSSDSSTQRASSRCSRASSPSSDSR